MEEYDVIVVGLSCAGISTAYYCAKKGLKVLGLEQYSCPGSIGSSSFGETRQWSAIYPTKLKNTMMWEAVKLWKEMEEESGEKLLVSLPFLWMGSMQCGFFKEMVDVFTKIKLLNADEIKEKFPAIKNIPSDYKGLLTMDGGIVQAKKALKVGKDLAEMKYGARLLFNTKVSKFFKDKVETADGTTYTAKHVIMTCGVNCLDYTTCEEEHHKKDIGYAVMSDGSGLPGGFLEYDHTGQEYYGMADGEKLEGYKMGVTGNGKVDRIIEYYLNRIPDKIDKVKYLQLCRECYAKSENFQYKTDENGVHFAYAFGGEGFMFFPMHGKVIYDGLISILQFNWSIKSIIL